MHFSKINKKFFFPLFLFIEIKIINIKYIQSKLIKNLIINADSVFMKKNGTKLVQLDYAECK